MEIEPRRGTQLPRVLEGALQGAGIEDGLRGLAARIGLTYQTVKDIRSGRKRLTRQRARMVAQILRVSEELAKQLFLAGRDS